MELSVSSYSYRQLLPELIRQPGAAERVVLLLADREDSRLLGDLLTPQYAVQYELSTSATEVGGPDIDLCIVDGVSLRHHGRDLSAARAAQEPVLLPILLLAARPDVGSLTREVWEIVDDVLPRPVAKLELRLRIESLLRARRLSLKLRELGRKLRDLLESVPDAMVISDAAGKIVLINAQTELLFGYRRDELLEQPLETLVPERFRNRHVSHRQGYYAQPKVRPMGIGLQLYGRRKDGTEVPVEISLGPLASEEGPLFISIIRDSSERISLEDTRRNAIVLQRAMLPQELPQTDRTRISWMYVPSKDDMLVGGDWYDAFLRDDGLLVLSIGDVCGNGVETVATMDVARQAIRVTADYEPDPAAVLAAVDRRLKRDCPDSIVTAAVCFLDLDSLQLQYALAGHPPPLLREANSTITALSKTGLPLGMRGSSEAAATTVNLSAGSLLVLYTDGLTEATRDLAEGEARLLNALTDVRVIGADNVAKAIYDAVLNGEAAHDDTAIVTLEIP